MPLNRSITIVIAAIVSIAAGVLLSRAWLARGPIASYPAIAQGTLIEPPRPLPPFALIDHTATPFGPARLKSRWTFVFFGFTHCPDICPVTLAVLAQVHKSLADLPEPQQPQIALVSVDPQRDTPAQLAQYLRSFGASIVGLTGEQSQLDLLTRHMAVPVAVRDGGEGDYAVDHSGAIFLIDPNGALRALFSAPHTPAALADDYRRLITQAAT